jgi:hypothetical protein
VDRDEILKIAKGCGFASLDYGQVSLVCNTNNLIDFANAIAAHERDEILLTVMEQAREAKPYTRLSHVLTYLLINIRARGNK